MHHKGIFRLRNRVSSLRQKPGKSLSRHGETFPSIFLFSLVALTLSVCCAHVLWHVLSAVLRLSSQLDDDLGWRSLDKSGEIRRAIKGLGLGSTDCFERSQPCASLHLFSQEKERRDKDLALSPAPLSRAKERQWKMRGFWVRTLAWVKRISWQGHDVIRHFKNIWITLFFHIIISGVMKVSHMHCC